MLAAEGIELGSKLTSRDKPFVRFDMIEVRDGAVKDSIAYKMVPVAVITPPGSRDTHFERIPEWWTKLDTEARTGRVLPEWVEGWKRDYALYEKGQAIPTEGTPILGWRMVSKSQQDMLIRANILTVEHLAGLNAEGVANVGMGAVELKRRAEAWLLQHTHEKAACETLELARENASLKAQIDSLNEKMKELEAYISEKKSAKKG